MDGGRVRKSPPQEEDVYLFVRISHILAPESWELEELFSVSWLQEKVEDGIFLIGEGRFTSATWIPLVESGNSLLVIKRLIIQFMDYPDPVCSWPF